MLSVVGKRDAKLEARIYALRYVQCGLHESRPFGGLATLANYEGWVWFPVCPLRGTFVELISWEHVACPLSGIKRRPLVGGWLNISCIVVSIRAIASVRYREVVRSWEGPLWEVPL